MRGLRNFILFVLLIGLGLAGVAFWQHHSRSNRAAYGANPDVSPPPPPPSVVPGTSLLEEVDRQFVWLVHSSLPSVVSIDARPKMERSASVRPWQWQGRQEPETPRMGSGVIVSEEGYIVTNLHVVRGADSILVQLADGRDFPATLRGSDPLTDIAILKIEASGLKAMEFANSDEVRVGQAVFAVGNPFGLQESVTRGIISGRDRRGSSEIRNEFLQTDTQINPGNSGGPLIDMRGEVVGINNFIFGGLGAGPEISFAIPSNIVRKVFEDISSYGRVTRPYLGVELAEQIPAQWVSRLGLPDSEGVLIQDVSPDSPAARANLQRGDVIRRFGQKRVIDVTDLRNRIAETKVGREVDLEIYRDGEPKTVKLKIEEWPRSASSVSLPVRPPQNRGALDGLIAIELHPEMLQNYQPNVDLDGVLVSGFLDAAPAAEVLRQRDIILEINGDRIRTIDDLREVAEAMPPSTPATASFARGNYLLRGQIDPR